MDDISHELLQTALPSDLKGKKVILLGCQSRMATECTQRGAAHTYAVHLLHSAFRESVNNSLMTHYFEDPAYTTLKLPSADLILFPITKSSIHNLKLIAFAQSICAENGIIHIAGFNNGGIKGIASKLKKMGIPSTVAVNKRGGRVLALNAETPVSSNTYQSEVTPYIFKDKTIEVETVPGLFSYKKEDKGTQLLLKHFPRCSRKKVLDVGCGSGILSIAAAEAGAQEVTATDISATAVALSTKNCAPYDTITVVGGDMANNIDEYFDIIVTNPPFHDGLKTDLSTGERWLDSLLPRIHKGSAIWLVANAFITYGIMGRKRFSSVERIAEENGFIIYKMVK